MNKYCLISMLSASILISGCDHYTTKMAMMDSSNGDVSAIEPASGGEMTFSGYLAAQYFELAEYEQYVTSDYLEAKKYFNKAEQLSNGQMVALNQVDDYKIEGIDKIELIEARQEIENALQVYRIPENRYNLAIAHSRYDCWVDETAEGKEGSSCEIQFRQAMNSLTKPYDIYTEEAFYNDFFDLDI